MVIYLSLLVALIALVIYILSANPKIQQLAIYAWAAGLLAFLLSVGGAHTVGLLGR